MKKLKLFIIFAFATIALSAYSYVAFERNQYPTLPEFLANKEKYQGRQAVLKGDIVDIRDGSFVFSSNGAEITVIFSQPVRKAVLGTSLVLGVYDKSGVFIASKVENLDYNYLKYLVSLFAIAVIAYYAKKEWRLGIPMGDKNA